MGCQVGEMFYIFFVTYHLVEEVGAAHSADLADVVHETQVALCGAVELAHSDLAETSVELPPHVLPEPVSHTHVHLVLLLPLGLMGNGVNSMLDTSRALLHLKLTSVNNIAWLTIIYSIWLSC